METQIQDPTLREIGHDCSLEHIKSSLHFPELLYIGHGFSEGGKGSPGTPLLTPIHQVTPISREQYFVCQVQMCLAYTV